MRRCPGIAPLAYNNAGRWQRRGVTMPAATSFGNVGGGCCLVSGETEARSFYVLRWGLVLFFARDRRREQKMVTLLCCFCFCCWKNQQDKGEGKQTWCVACELPVRDCFILRRHVLVSAPWGCCAANGNRSPSAFGRLISFASRVYHSRQGTSDGGWTLLSMYAKNSPSFRVSLVHSLPPPRVHNKQDLSSLFRMSRSLLSWLFSCCRWDFVL